MILVQMPKTATTALSAHIGQPHSHRRAADLPDGYKFGVLRHPLDWYRSWLGHINDWTNERCRRALEGLGPDPIWGLTHLDEIDRSCLPEQDHLFSPGGLEGASTMWQAHMHWWFDGVQELVPIRELRGLGVEVANDRAPVPILYKPAWLWEDLRMYSEAWDALVMCGDSPARSFIRNRGRE